MGSAAGDTHGFESREEGRLPWALVGASLLGMASLYQTGEEFFGLWVFAGSVVAARLVGPRAPNRFMVRWGSRIVLFATLLTLLGLPEEEVQQWYVKSEFMRRIGALLAGELAIRAWIIPQRGKVAREWGEMLVLAGLVMLCSTTTTDIINPVAVIAPLFTVAALWGARDIARVGTSSGEAGRGNGGGAWPVGQRVAAFVLVLGMGYGGIVAARVVEEKVTGWAVEWSKSLRSQRTEIGLSVTPQLREVFNPEPSIERVLKVENARGEKHLRVMAFDRYESHTWLPRGEERRFEDVGATDLRQVSGGRGADPEKRMRVVPMPSMLMEYMAVPTEANGVYADFRISRDQLGGLRVADGERAVFWGVDTRGGEGMEIPLLPGIGAEEREWLSRMPLEVDSRVAELAREVAGEGDEQLKVWRISMYLRSNHGYSLKFTPEGEPLTDFILNKRDAHCQYFASAVVVMARAVGIPARYVTGFYAHEADGGDVLTVRQRDAHAWAECYVEGRGWVIADATPGGGRPDGLFERPGLQVRTWEKVKDFPGAAQQWLMEGGLETTGKLVAGGIILIALGRLGWVVGGRLLRSWGAPAEPLDPRLKALRARIERIVVRRVGRLSPDSTWRERLGEEHADVTALLRGYERARFGGMKPGEIDELARGVGRIERDDNTNNRRQTHGRPT